MTRSMQSVKAPLVLPRFFALLFCLSSRLVLSRKPICGNGVVEGSEQCEPPDLSNGCSDDCKIVNVPSATTTTTLSATTMTSNDLVSILGRYKTASMKKYLTFCGHKPPGPGSFPVFVYVTGTKMSPCSSDDEAVTRAAASRGFVAISVDYGTRRVYPGNCATLHGSVEEIFSEADDGSAVNTLLRDSVKNSTNLGVATMGFSQGANIASLAKNYNADVRAAFLIGNGYQDWGMTCYATSNLVLSRETIRSVIGQNDDIFQNGGGPEDNREQMVMTTGYNECAGLLSCIQQDGSGWYLVQGSETAEGQDDHCFHYGDGFCGDGFDANFLDGDGDWTLPSSLDWLTKFFVPIA